MPLLAPVIRRAHEKKAEFQRAFGPARLAAWRSSLVPYWRPLPDPTSASGAVGDLSRRTFDVAVDGTGHSVQLSTGAHFILAAAAACGRAPIGQRERADLDLLYGRHDDADAATARDLLMRVLEADAAQDATAALINDDLAQRAILWIDGSLHGELTHIAGPPGDVYEVPAREPGPAWSANGVNGKGGRNGVASKVGNGLIGASELAGAGWRADADEGAGAGGLEGSGNGGEAVGLEGSEAGSAGWRQGIERRARILQLRASVLQESGRAGLCVLGVSKTQRAHFLAEALEVTAKGASPMTAQTELDPSDGELLATTPAGWSHPLLLDGTSVAARVSATARDVLRECPAIVSCYVRPHVADLPLRVDVPASFLGIKTPFLPEASQAIGARWLPEPEVMEPVIAAVLARYGGIEVYNAPLYAVDRVVRLSRRDLEQRYLPICAKIAGLPPNALGVDRGRRRFLLA